MAIDTNRRLDKQQNISIYKHPSIAFFCISSALRSWTVFVLCFYGYQFRLFYLPGHTRGVTCPELLAATSSLRSLNYDWGASDLFRFLVVANFEHDRVKPVSVVMTGFIRFARPGLDARTTMQGSPPVCAG